jgi:hypothetical protein
MKLELFILINKFKSIILKIISTGPPALVKIIHSLRKFLRSFGRKRRGFVWEFAFRTSLESFELPTNLPSGIHEPVGKFCVLDEDIGLPISDLNWISQWVTNRDYIRIPFVGTYRHIIIRDTAINFSRLNFLYKSNRGISTTEKIRSLRNYITSKDQSVEDVAKKKLYRRGSK